MPSMPNGDGLGLDDEQRRVLERYHTIFVRAGARLDPAGKKRLAEINERMATLGTLFSQNVLADEKAWTLVLAARRPRRPARLAGRDAGAGSRRLVVPRRQARQSPCRAPRSNRSCNPRPRRDLREKAFCRLDPARRERWHQRQTAPSQAK